MRDTRDYRNLLIVELPIGDFGFTMARQTIIDLFNQLYLKQLTKSADATLAAIAAKALKETDYHLRRSQDWVLRLGDGTDESHQRIQQGFDQLWGYVSEMFVMTADESALLAEGVSVDRAALRDTWDTQLNSLLNKATLQWPDSDWQLTGGREGLHTEHHGHLLAEMQFMQRAYPGLKW